MFSLFTISPRRSLTLSPDQTATLDRLVAIEKEKLAAFDAAKATLDTAQAALNQAHAEAKQADTDLAAFATTLHG